MADLTRRSVLTGIGALLGSLSISPVLGEEVGDTYNYLIGDRVVTIKTHRNGAGPTLVCPHDNENTAVTAALRIIARHGGRVIELIHNGERNISFMHKGVRYTFDPNRMFSSRGIKESLETLGDKNYSEDAHDMIHQFADVFVTHFNAPRSSLIVAIHNNTQGAYSIASYAKGGEYVRDARRVYVNKEADPDDFFFVTSERLFFSLSNKGFNVVLQSRRATNDGSLSVYAAAQGIPYVNVEAQSGHLSMQKQMLEALL